ncbi:MAG: hypothetical protein U1E30_03020 [Rhodoblastus sp.]
MATTKEKKAPASALATVTRQAVEQDDGDGEAGDEVGDRLASAMRTAARSAARATR